METSKEQIEKAIENESAQFRLRTIKKYIPTFTAKPIRREVVSRAFGNVKGNRYKYTIKIGKADGKQFTFVFYDSINAYKTNAKLNIFDAIWSMVVDYISYRDINDFKYFVAEFGYNIDDKKQLAEARRAFNGCESIYTKVTRVFSPDELEVLEAACNDYN